MQIRQILLTCFSLNIYAKKIKQANESVFKILRKRRGKNYHPLYSVSESLLTALQLFPMPCLPNIKKQNRSYHMITDIFHTVIFTKK